MWWIVFLGFRPQNGSHHLLGRETCLESVEWYDDWPIVNGTGTADIQKQIATLPQVEAPQLPMNRLAFGDKEPYFLHLNTPVGENYQFVRDTVLRLKPTRVTLDEAGSPTFMAIRQDKFDFRLDTEVDLSSATLGDYAGLTVYMENNAHADIFLRQEKSKKKQSIVVEFTLYGLKHKACEVEVNKGPTQLRVDGSKTEYKFFYRDAKGKWVEAGTLDTRMLSTETAGGFTGITLGMYAVSPRGGGFSCADFKYFRYR
jgi:alpha-N-arabinofuranosidase